MKLFDKYFQPYAEYCLRTTLSEDELKEALAKECPATSDILSWKAIKAAIGLSKTIVFSCDPDDPLHLHPIKAYRNTSRGDLFIRCEKAAGEETILHISIAPNGKYKWFCGKRINNPNTHGTGCTLSSAIASNLAKGYDLETSIQRAKDYISGALAAMLDLGQESGPMNHAFSLNGDFSI